MPHVAYAARCSREKHKKMPAHTEHAFESAIEAGLTDSGGYEKRQPAEGNWKIHYLWDEALRADSLLEILQRFMHLEVKRPAPIVLRTSPLTWTACSTSSSSRAWKATMGSSQG